MTVIDTAEILFDPRLDDDLAPISSQDRASAVARTADFAREHGLAPTETLELVAMLGLDGEPWVQQVLTRAATA